MLDVQSRRHFYSQKFYVELVWPELGGFKTHGRIDRISRIFISAKIFFYFLLLYLVS